MKIGLIQIKTLNKLVQTSNKKTKIYALTKC